MAPRRILTRSFNQQNAFSWRRLFVIVLVIAAVGPGIILGCIRIGATATASYENDSLSCVLGELRHGPIFIELLKHKKELSITKLCLPEKG